MDIARLSRLIDAMSARLSDEHRITQGSRNSSLPSYRNAATVSRPPILKLREIITSKINSLPDQERQPAKVKRLFMESVLLWEFGDEFINDSKFDGLVNEVINVLNSNPESSAKMDKMLNELSEQ